MLFLSATYVGESKNQRRGLLNHEMNKRISNGPNFS